MRTSLKILILTTIGVSLASGFAPKLSLWLSLSWAGLADFYLWQLFSYPFLEKGAFSFSFLIRLSFHMYLLWVFGSSLLDRCRPFLFFVLYFGAPLAAALALPIFPNAILAGSVYSIYAVLTAWMMLNPNSELLLFFTLPFKAQWLILALIGISLLTALTNGNWADASALFLSAAYGYLFTLIALRHKSPFLFLAPFERKILTFLEKKKKKFYHPSKIFDIQSGEPILDDNQFMDAMLDKISSGGTASLSSAEKKRMEEISQRKKEYH